MSISGTIGIANALVIGATGSLDLYNFSRRIVAMLYCFSSLRQQQQRQSINNF
jgi:hypothetical protein